MGGQDARWVHRFLEEELHEHAGPTLLADLKRSGTTAEIDSQLLRTMADVGASELRIHGLDGDVLWSARPGEIGTARAPDALLADALAGTPSSRVGADGLPDASKTVVPLRGPDGDIAGAAVVVHPSPAAVQALARVRSVVWGGALAGSLVLFAVLTGIITVGRRKELALQRDLWKQEAALSRERTKLETIVQGLGVGLCLVDTDRRVLWANPVLTEMTGATEGATWHPCAPAREGATEPCASCPTAAAMRSGQESRVERVVVRPDGSRRRLLIAAWPMRDESGRPTQALELVQDVTERRQHEEQAANQEKMAALGRVAAGVAHEVGNPLSSISALIQLMARRGRPGIESELASLRDHVRRISETVRTVQGFARPGTKVRDLVDVNDVLRKALAVARLDDRWRTVEVRDALAPTPLTVRGNADQLVQVFLNLLLNSADAMEGAGTVELRTRRAGAAVVASVQDSGPGVPADRAAQIFEPFFTTKEPGRGTGLGLHVSWNIITEHGGTIKAARPDGGGAEFVVRLPALDTAVGAA